MSLQNVTLKYVTVASVYGKSFKDELSDEDSPNFKARFGLTVDSEDLGEEKNSFEVKLKFETLFSEDGEPFFKIEIVGHFDVDDDLAKTAEWISTPDAAHILGTSIYPYLRHLSKPLLEGLGAGDVEFPWGPPRLVPKKEKKPRRKTIKKE